MKLLLIRLNLWFLVSKGIDHLTRVHSVLRSWDRRTHSQKHSL